MSNIPQLLVESSFCLIVFYAFYHVVLSKETFFQLNRLYLLLTPCLAIIIPLVNIQLSAGPTPADYHPLVRTVYPIIEQSIAWETQIWAQSEPRSRQITVSDLVLAAYLLGGLIMLIQLVSGLVRLYRVISRSRVQKVERYRLVPDTNFPASSFFGFVFWKGDRLTDQQRIVWEHEKVHIRQWHSLDVLLMECWVILQWFNPLIYFFRNSLRVTHEYIADRYVAGQLGSKYAYATYLAKFIQIPSRTPLLNNFAQLLKKRLIMLAQKKSQHWKYGKYLLAFPLFFSLMMLFSFDMVEDLPEPISQAFDSAENYLRVAGDKEITRLPEAPEEKEIVDPPVSLRLFSLPSKPIPALQSNYAEEALQAPDRPLVLTPAETTPASIFSWDRLYEKLQGLPKNKPTPGNFQLQWQDKICDCKEGQLPKYYNCENRSFQAREFRKIARAGGFKLMQDGQATNYRDLQVFSKESLKIKKIRNQHDFQNVFNPKSPFWKKLDEGDVLKFTFHDEANNVFEFDLTINDQKGSFDHAYDFYIGDIWVPIDMTNNLGIKFLDYETFKSSLDKPLKLLKNVDESVDIEMLTASHVKIKYDPKRKAADYPAISIAMPGRGVSFIIRTTEGRKFTVNLKIKDDKQLRNAPNDFTMEWGSLSSREKFPRFLISKTTADELADSPMKLVALDGRKLSIANIGRIMLNRGAKSEGGRSSMRSMKYWEIQTSCSNNSFEQATTCLRDILKRSINHDEVILSGIQTSEGQYFDLTLKLYEEEVLHDHRHFSTMEKRQTPPGYPVQVLQMKSKDLNQKNWNEFVTYRTLDGKVPNVFIDLKEYHDEEAIEQLRKLHHYQIDNILFESKANRNRRNLYYGNKEVVDRPLLRIMLKRSDVIRKYDGELVEEQAGVLGGDTGLAFEDLGRNFFVVVDGHKRGIMSGTSVKDLILKITPAHIEKVEVMKGSEALVSKYGEEARDGVVIIATKK